jgi:hypothetical protein
VLPMQFVTPEVTLESGLCVVLVWFLPDTLPAVMRFCFVRGWCFFMRWYLEPHAKSWGCKMVGRCICRSGRQGWYSQHLVMECWGTQAGSV